MVTPHSRATTRTWLGALVLAVTALVLAVGCWYLLFSTFLLYDDEGYVLISLRAMQAGHALYKEVFSQYGPGFYTLYNSIFGLLHLEWTNVSARILTLIHWLLAAGLCADLVRRRTGSLAAAAFTLAGVTKLLWVMVSEPGHPGGSIVFLVALAAWIGARRDPANDVRSALLLGGIVALLSLIKINVGFLLGFSLLVWFGMRLPSGRARQLVRLALAIAAAALPWMLMRPLLYEKWVQYFAALESVCGFGLVASLQSMTAPAIGRKQWFGFIVGGLSVAALVVGYTVIRGTSLADLFEGVVLSPLRHPLIYSLSPNFRPGTLGVAVGSSALALWSLHRPADLRLQRLILALRVLAGVLTALCFLDLVPMLPAGFALSFGVGLTPLFVLPLGESAKEQTPLAAWLGTLLVWQSLHSFPIAGSQLNWGTYLWVPMLVVGIHDGFVAQFPQFSPSGRNWSKVIGPIACGIVALVIAGTRLQLGYREYHMGEPTGLRGMEKMVLSEDYVHSLRAVTENIEAHAGTLYSLPGVFSFNLWSGRPTPNFQNVTHWFSLLNQEQQETIAGKLLADPKAVIVVQQGLLKYLIDNHFFKGGYLADFIGREFYPTFEVGGYGFWVHNGRKVAPINTADLIPNELPKQVRTLSLCLAGKTHAPSSLTISALAGSVRSPLLHLTAQEATLQVTPLDENGEPTGAAQPVAWGEKLPAAALVRLTMTLPSLALPGVPLVVSAEDANGKAQWFAPVIHHF